MYGGWVYARKIVVKVNPFISWFAIICVLIALAFKYTYAQSVQMIEKAITPSLLVGSLTVLSLGL